MEDTTENLPLTALRRSCSSQATRPASLTALDVDLVRRLAALLSTISGKRRSELSWDAVRALVALLSPDRLEDVEASEAIADSVLDVTITRRLEEWSLILVCTVDVDPWRQEYDSWDVQISELVRGEQSVRIDARCELTDGETDYVVELVEAHRSFLARREASDQVARGEECAP